MKKILTGIILGGIVTLITSIGGGVHAEDTMVNTITVPKSVSTLVAKKVTLVAPKIMALIDAEGGKYSKMYTLYTMALTKYAEKFQKNGDSEKEWIANTLLSYAEAYYDTSGVETVVVEEPIVVDDPIIEESTVVEQDTINVQKDFVLEQKILDDMKALWKTQKLRSYTMIQQLGCNCTSEFTRPVKVSVSNDRVKTSTANYYDGRRESVDSLGPRQYTVNEFFDIIQQAIDDNVDGLDTEYHPTEGYPVSIGIDTSFEIADEEKYYTIQVF